jgi:hypothetical protein
MYKEATKKGMRIQTERGPLSVEQLWDLLVEELDKLAVSLDEEYKKSGKRSYLTPKSTKDKELKLQRDIVIDILETKVEEHAATNNAQTIKVHNQKIEALIQKKKDESLESLSIEELEKKLK